MPIHSWATITSGFPGDDFTAPGNGGLALAQFGGDLGGYFDQVVAPRIHGLSERFVYLEAAGFGINNSADPIYLDTVAYDVVIVAESAPVADLADFAAFQTCFTGGAGVLPLGFGLRTLMAAASSVFLMCDSTGQCPLVIASYHPAASRTKIGA